MVFFMFVFSLIVNPVVRFRTVQSAFVRLIVSVTLILLAGCSTDSVRNSQYPQSKPRIPAPLPEITSTVERQPRVTTVIEKKRAPVATVERYDEGKSNHVISQREARTVMEPDTKKQAEITVFADVQQEPTPYDGIKTDALNKQETSPAVKSLLVRAKADLALGNEQSAISKLERALRIEPSNANVWLSLAKAHQSIGEYQQAITMARKAIGFAAGNEKLTGQGWELIHAAGKASGDTTAVREALDYRKTTP